MSLLAVPLIAASLMLGPTDPAPAMAASPAVVNPTSAPTAPSAQPDKEKEEEKKPKKPEACTGKAKELALCKDPKAKEDDGGGIGDMLSPSSWAKKAFDSIAKSFGDASIEMIKWSTSWWIAVDSPQLSAAPDSPVGFLRTHTRWLTGFGIALGLLFAAARTAWERRGEPLRDALAGLIRLVVVSGCSVVVANLVIEAGDSYSTAVWNAGAQGTDLSVAGGVLFGAGAAAVLSNPAVMMVLGLLVMLSSLVQFAMLMLRSIMLVVLVGLLPVAASASLTPEGNAWLRRMLGWFVAFAFYQPVAATLYAVAFTWMKSGDGLEPLQGFILVIAAVMALPALMRFVAPAVASATGGGGGGAAALAGAAALGARALPALGRGSGGQGGPTGARLTPSGKGASDRSGEQQTPDVSSKPSTAESATESAVSSPAPDPASKGSDSPQATTQSATTPQGASTPQNGAAAQGATSPQGATASQGGPPVHASAPASTASGAASGTAAVHPAAAAASLIADGARFGKQVAQGAVNNATTTQEGDVPRGAQG